MKRKLMTIILSILAVLSFTFVLVGCNDETEAKNDEYHQGLEFCLKDDGTYGVSVGYAKNLSNIVIPSTYLGKDITEINEDGFAGDTKLTSITIPNTVKSMGANAFYGCSSLTSITIPNSVTSIGEDAFKYCSSLESVTIGNSVESIGDYAFRYCDKLVEVINLSKLNITKGSSSNGYVGYYALNIKNSGTSDIVNVNDYLFYTYDNTNYLLGYVGTDTDLTLPESYNGQSYEIYKYAFYRCSSLTSVTIPNSVTSIGDWAFYNCTSLTSVTIGNSVTSIGELAFMYCVSLTSITIPNSVTSIGDEAFYSCSSLTSVTIPDSVESIGDWAFEYCSSLTSVTIPNSVTSIGISAFCACSSLESVTIGNSVTSIGSYAFSNCYKLVEVINLSKLNITKGSKDNGYIGYYALNIKNGGTSEIVKVNNYLFYTYDNTNYLLGYVGTETELVLPDNYNGQSYEIYKYAFYWQNPASNHLLTSVVIGNSVESIGYDAFSNCYKLVEVINLSKLNITKGSSSNGYVGYYALNIKNSGTSDIINVGGYLFYTYDNTNYLLGYVGTDTDLTLPESYNGQVYEIYKYAFYDCSKLASVTIPNSVTSIGDWAFYNCRSLTSITIPESVTSIGDRAFYDCRSLTSVTIGNSVTSIGDYAFEDCRSLTSVTIGESVESIGYYAFYKCSSLTSITIPDSVTSIGDYAFSGCDSLTSITFSDTTGWYRVSDYDKWQNKTGGTATNVTNPTTNATYFKSTYKNYNWYKK